MDKSFEILVLKDGEREKQRKEERKALMDTERLRRRKEEERKRKMEKEKEKEKEKEEEEVKEDIKKNEKMIDNTYDTDDIDDTDDIFICRGPNLKNKRSKHASIIIQNYLYVIFGYVQDGDKPTMSFERIEIPPPNMTKTNIDDFYKSREWEYYEINNSYDWNVYFSCSNCIKTLDNNLVFYGTKRKLVLRNNNSIDRINGSFKYLKIVAKLNVQKVSFTISETDLSKWSNPTPSKTDKIQNNEDQKLSEENKKPSKEEKPSEEENDNKNKENEGKSVL